MSLASKPVTGSLKAIRIGIVSWFDVWDELLSTAAVGRIES
jgi:hypothetical protein